MKHKIPKFKSETEERAFWASHDSADYIDWKKGNTVIFPNLRPSLKSISLRLPESMIEELRLLANKKDVPYQSLVKVFLSERIAQELHSHPELSWATHSMAADKAFPAGRYFLKRSKK